MKLIPRQAAKALQRLLRTFPAVLVYGPRQCGKSTLVRATLPRWTHLDLEQPRQAALFDLDLEGTLAAYPRHLAIDEAQRRPELFPALRSAIDARPGKGRFVLLGSAGPSLLSRVSESLAGRIGTLELTPFLAAELVGRRPTAERWFWGGFPPVHALRGPRARAEWIDGYVTAVVERDLPALGVLLPPTRLRLLLAMLAHVHGNLLNMSDLARSLRVSVPTVARDLDVLEGVFLIRRLYPYAANIQKRLTKSPKLYLRDSGVLHVLAGLRRPEELVTWPRRGASFEGLVLEEIITLAHARVVRPGVFFWRTEAGGEVDLLIVDGQRIVPIEIKLGAAVDHHALRGLRACMADLGIHQGWVVVGSGERTKVGRDLELVPWGDIVSGACDFGFGRKVTPV
jgi:hypothetical protein